MSGRARRFRPGLALTLVCAAAFAVLSALGTWQLQRLAWKTELNAKAGAAATAPPVELADAGADLAALEFRRVRLKGSYLGAGSVALGLVTLDGRAGSRLLTPFRLRDGRTVLVDRGFVPEERLREALGVPAPEGSRVVEGLVRRAGTGSWATPAPDLRVPRWYAPDTEAIGRHLGLALEPFLVILQEREEGGGAFPQPIPVTVDLPNPHLGYAVTWYGLAASLLAFYILLGFRRNEEETR